MADEAAIRELARGVEVWNAFRARVADKIDLTRLEIRNADLHGIDFTRVDLDRTTFVDVDLRHASFRGAAFNGVRATDTCFDGAIFVGAEIKGSDLTRVCLRGCDLSGVEPYSTWIRDASLRGAVLTRVRWVSGHVYNSDLTGVEWQGFALEKSTMKRVVVDASLLAHANDNGWTLDLPNLPYPEKWLPCEGFARGRPGDDPGMMIDRRRNRTTWMVGSRWHFFTSYASVDRDAVAAPLKAELDERGYRTWIDGTEVKAGHGLEAVIDFGTAASVHGVVVLGKTYLGREWTERELGRLAHKRLFVVLHGMRP